MEDAKRKSIAAMVVAKMAPKQAPEAEMEDGESEEGYEIDGREEAASELMSALSANDSAAFADALESFIEICRNKED